MYIRKVTIAGRTVIVEENHTYRYKCKGLTRSDNIKPTKQSQAMVNMRKRIMHMTIMMNHNYRGGDYHLCLTYETEKRPETLADADKILDTFLQRLRRECKKRKIDIKYIVATEVGKRGALHHHMVIHKMDTAILDKCWTWGWYSISSLHKNGQYSKLASYFVKYQEQWKAAGEKGRGWRRSRNLEIPEPKVKVLKRNTYPEEPKAKKGYYVDMDTVRIGVSEYTGYPFRKYIMIKDERGSP